MCVSGITLMLDYRRQRRGCTVYCEADRTLCTVHAAVACLEAGTPGEPYMLPIERDHVM